MQQNLQEDVGIFTTCSATSVPYKNPAPTDVPISSVPTDTDTLHLVHLDSVEEEEEDGGTGDTSQGLGTVGSCHTAAEAAEPTASGLEHDLQQTSANPLTSKPFEESHADRPMDHVDSLLTTATVPAPEKETVYVADDSLAGMTVQAMMAGPGVVTLGDDKPVTLPIDLSDAMGPAEEPPAGRIPSVTRSCPSLTAYNRSSDRPFLSSVLCVVSSTAVLNSAGILNTRAGLDSLTGRTPWDRPATFKSPTVVTSPVALQESPTLVLDSPSNEVVTIGMPDCNRVSPRNIPEETIPYSLPTNCRSPAANCSPKLDCSPAACCDTSISAPASLVSPTRRSVWTSSSLCSLAQDVVEEIARPASPQFVSNQSLESTLSTVCQAHARQQQQCFSTPISAPDVMRMTLSTSNWALPKKRILLRYLQSGR